MIENIILSRLRVAYEKNINKITVKYSSKAFSFLRILKAEGFIYSFKQSEKNIVIVLNYNNHMVSLLNIKTFSKISKPFFVKHKDIVTKIKNIKNVIFILQTDKGLISNDKILTTGLGGILIAILK